MSKTINYISDEAGQGLVEYAIVLPIFLMLVFMIIGYSSLLYEKLSFNIALRDAIFKIEFNEEEEEYFKRRLNPFGDGSQENRYFSTEGDEPYVEQGRAKEFHMNEKFIMNNTAGEYLKREIAKRNNNINIDNIEFLDFEEGRPSKIGIYSGLQHYHYKKPVGADGRNFQSDEKFSTILIARLRVNYKINPSNPILKSIYPEGVDHEKVVYKVSRGMRWDPVIKNPSVRDPLDRYEVNR